MKNSRYEIEWTRHTWAGQEGLVREGKAFFLGQTDEEALAKAKASFGQEIGDFSFRVVAIWAIN